MIKRIDQLSLEILNNSPAVTHQYMRVLVQHWQNIVGEKLALHSKPLKISIMPVDSQSKHKQDKRYKLLLTTTSIYAPFFYFSYNDILEKVNHYVGKNVFYKLHTVLSHNNKIMEKKNE